MALHLIEFAKYASSTIAHQIKMCAWVKISHGSVGPHLRPRTPLRVQTPYVPARHIICSSCCGRGTRNADGGLFRIVRDIEKGPNSNFPYTHCTVRLRSKQTGNRSLPSTPATPLIPNYMKQKHLFTQQPKCHPETASKSRGLDRTGAQKFYPTPALGGGNRNSGNPSLKTSSDTQYRNADKKSGKSNHSPKSANQKSEWKTSVKAKRKKNKFDGETDTKNIGFGINMLKKECKPKEDAAKPLEKSVQSSARRETNLNQGFIKPVSSLAKEMNEWLNAVREHLIKLEESEKARGAVNKRGNKRSKSIDNLSLKPTKKLSSNSASNISTKSSAPMAPNKMDRSEKSSALLNAESARTLQFIDPGSDKVKSTSVGLGKNFNSKGPGIQASSDSGLTKDLDKLNQEINRLKRERDHERDSLRPGQSRTTKKPKDSEGLLEIRPTIVENIPNEKEIPKKAASLAEPLRPLESLSMQSAQHTRVSKKPRREKDLQQKPNSVPLVSVSSWKPAKNVKIRSDTFPNLHQEKGFVLLDKTMNSNADSRLHEDTEIKPVTTELPSDNSVGGSKAQRAKRRTHNNCAEDGDKGFIFVNHRNGLEGNDKGFILVNHSNFPEGSDKGFTLVKPSEKPRPLDKSLTNSGEKKQTAAKISSKEKNVVYANGNPHSVLEKTRKQPQKDAATLPTPQKEGSPQLAGKFTVSDDGIFGSVSTQRKPQTNKEDGKSEQMPGPPEMQKANNSIHLGMVSKATSPKINVGSKTKDHSRTETIGKPDWSKIVREKLKEMQNADKLTDAKHSKTDLKQAWKLPVANSSQNSRIFNVGNKFGRAFEDIVKETQQLIEETEAAMRVAKKHSAINRSYGAGSSGRQAGKSEIKPIDQIYVNDKLSSHERLSGSFPSSSSLHRKSTIRSPGNKKKAQNIRMTDLTPEIKPKSALKQLSPVNVGAEKKNAEPRLCVKPEEVSKKGKRAAVTSADVSRRSSSLLNPLDQTKVSSTKGDIQSVGTDINREVELPDITDHEMWSRRLKARLAEYQKVDSTDPKQHALKKKTQDNKLASPVNATKTTNISGKISPTTSLLNEIKSLEAVAATASNIRSPKSKTKQVNNKINEPGQVSSDISLTSLKVPASKILRAKRNEVLMKEIQNQWSRDFKINYLRSLQARMESNQEAKSKQASRNTEDVLVDEDLDLTESPALGDYSKQTSLPAPTATIIRYSEPPSSEVEKKVNNAATEPAVTRSISQQPVLQQSTHKSEVTNTVRSSSDDDVMELSEVTEPTIKSSSQELVAGQEMDPFQEWIQSRDWQVTRNVAEQSKDDNRTFPNEKVTPAETVDKEPSTFIPEPEVAKDQDLFPIVHYDTQETYLYVPSKLVTGFKDRGKTSGTTSSPVQEPDSWGEDTDLSGISDSSTQPKPPAQEINKDSPANTAKSSEFVEAEASTKPDPVIAKDNKNLFGQLDGIVTMNARPVPVSSSPPTTSKSALKKKKNSRESSESKHVWFQNPLTVEEGYVRSGKYAGVPKRAPYTPDTYKAVLEQAKELQKDLAAQNLLKSGSGDVEGKGVVGSNPALGPPPKEKDMVGAVNRTGGGGGAGVQKTELSEGQGLQKDDSPSTDLRQVLAAERDQDDLEARNVLIKSCEENIQDYQACLAKYPALERYKERMKKARETGTTANSKARGDRANKDLEA